MPKLVDHKERRRELCEVAAGLVARGGLEAATIREIAAHSGYSKGVVEHYFESKQVLVSDVLAWANQCYVKRAAAATAGMSGLVALRRRVEATLPVDTATRDEWKIRLVFWSMAAIHPALRRQQGRRLEQTVGLFRDDLDAAVSAQEMPAAADTAERARHLFNLVTGICTAALHAPRYYTPARMRLETDYIMDRLRAGAI